MITQCTRRTYSISQTEALLKWNMKVIVKFGTINLCRLSRKSDLYWENMRSTLHDTSLVTCNTGCHWQSSLWGLQNKLGLPPLTHKISHLNFKPLFLLKHSRIFCFIASASKPLILFSLSLMSFIIFIVSNIRFFVFPTLLQNATKNWNMH
jgi:hypothetical protein